LPPVLASCFTHRVSGALKMPSSTSPCCFCCCCCRFEGTSHIEQPCNEISGPEKEAVASQMSRLAREYFKSLVADAHSFEKPTFFLGLDGWSVTNVLPDGAHARTPGRVELLPNGLSGFSKVGDSACFALEVSCPARAMGHGLGLASRAG
jgi:hypothetical protein